MTELKRLWNALSKLERDLNPKTTTNFRIDDPPSGDSNSVLKEDNFEPSDVHAKTDP